MNLEKVVKALKSNKVFLISAHTNLEGDAICSELSFARLLQKMGKKTFIVNTDKIPELYNFLPGVKSVSKFNGILPEYQVFCALDCADRERLGKISDFIERDKGIINIDHHKSNVNFGDINWVMPYTSSVCEMIYYLFKKTHTRIDKTSALLLYVGILTDTGSFKYSNTSPETHKIVAELLGKGLSAFRIYQQIYEANPLDEMKILSDIISSFETDKKKKIAWVEIKADTLQKLCSRIDIADNVFDFLRSIKGVEVTIIFKEINSRETKVNFRSRGKIDVSKFARIFGGGGHHNASGCNISKGLKDARQIVLKRLKRLV
ncbi:MAG: bifunctional oligoribonuclease/PAP phosphatase NrnA [Candidatus Omnitrophica bacterium]|nr:bifunctional oligoribonuclease/PAP phosphatase NrnA [Candidatus Omnitrophota bacterium]HOX54512.1 bifunctional oligoribonuclease/PAP phosphatase NrnA [Candidatus Omnitrophota bacterium]